MTLRPDQIGMGYGIEGVERANLASHYSDLLDTTLSGMIQEASRLGIREYQDMPIDKILMNLRNDPHWKNTNGVEVRPMIIGLFVEARLELMKKTGQ
ncbi:MAG: hypothetical protein JW816_01700 [Candidatus Buchananbacteria bacterium]|nr:hypothetical protein [Candidatus Buchananbacteria bacterium]